MFFTMLSNEGNVNDNVFKSRVRVEFVFRGVLDLSGYEENLMRIVQKIKRYDRVMEYLNFNVGAALLHSKPENANRWFNMVIDECGLSLFDICEGLCSIHGVTTEPPAGISVKFVPGFGEVTAGCVPVLPKIQIQIAVQDRPVLPEFSAAEHKMRMIFPEHGSADSHMLCNTKRACR